MAESVDALVSNTSRFTPVPVRPRLRVRKNPSNKLFYRMSEGFLFCVDVDYQSINHQEPPVNIWGKESFLKIDLHSHHLKVELLLLHIGGNNTD